MEGTAVENEIRRQYANRSYYMKYNICLLPVIRNFVFSFYFGTDTPTHIHLMPRTVCAREIAFSSEIVASSTKRTLLIFFFEHILFSAIRLCWNRFVNSFTHMAQVTLYFYWIWKTKTNEICHKFNFSNEKKKCIEWNWRDLRMK